jgi:hypothetical protein
VIIVFECLFTGWNFFTNKKIFKGLFLTIITLIFTYFNINFILNISEDIILLNTNSLYVIILNIIYTLNYKLIIVLILISLNLGLSNLTIYSISQIQAKKYKNKISNLKSVFQLTLLELALGIIISVISLVILHYFNLITAVIGLILFLCVICLFFISVISLTILGINPKLTLTNSLVQAWNFIKNKFWLIIVFYIFLAITLNIIYFIIDLFYKLFFEYQLTPIYVLLSLYFVLATIYTTNALAIFINKYLF